MKLKIYPEICCSDCKEVVHNHFDCPVCKKQYAGTSVYGAFVPDIKEENNVFHCTTCEATFWVQNVVNFPHIEVTHV